MHEQLALFPLPAVAVSDPATGCRHCGARLRPGPVPGAAAWVHAGTGLTRCAPAAAPHHDEPTDGQLSLPFGTEAA